MDSEKDPDKVYCTWCGKEIGPRDPDEPMHNDRYARIFHSDCFQRFSAAEARALGGPEMWTARHKKAIEWVATRDALGKALDRGLPGAVTPDLSCNCSGCRCPKHGSQSNPECSGAKCPAVIKLKEYEGALIVPRFLHQ